jgi:Transmembrane secretion effector
LFQLPVFAYHLQIQSVVGGDRQIIEPRGVTGSCDVVTKLGDAHDILHVGPLGLGVLRAAPAVGALLMTTVLARRSISRRAGPRMLGAVILFRLATIVFALSRWFWLSLIALAVLGAADTISVVIRTAFVQLRTPDAMRGRVGAVNFLFINASNQLGAFESGTVAAFLGAVPSALLGGIASIAVALVWMWLFPPLRTMERLE